MSIKGGVNLDLLKRKINPKPMMRMELKMKRTEPESININNDGDIEGDKEEKLIEYKIQEDEPIRVIKPQVLFVDKTKEVNVNHQLIMDRLKKNLNIFVTNKKIDKRKEKETDGFKIPLENQKFLLQQPSQPQKIKQTFIINEEEKKEIEEELPEELEKLEEELPEKLEVLEEANIQPIEEEKAPIKIKVKRTIKKQKDEPAQKEPVEDEGLQKEGEEEQEKAEPEKKKRITRKIQPKILLTDIVYDPKFKINKKPISQRLPKPEKLVIKTSDYYMNNRKLFIQKIAELFKPYRKEILDNTNPASCDSSQKLDFKLLTHQRVIRDYLNLYTPYRGLLLYHGLGTGKTCSAIAIAEGMKTQRPIVLMTPKSLKMNFFSELKKCGDIMYKKNQYWEFIQTTGKEDLVDTLAGVLKIPKEFILKNSGAWLVDVSKKEANFGELSTEQQEAIDEQLNMMIRSKYLDLNYNGLNMNKLRTITDDFTKNPFDNATVIIDEAHNLVSRIFNKINKPKSLSFILYDYLMKATNTKIVLLSGTPIINYPNELAILFNILRGYIKKWTFQLKIKDSAPSGFKLNRDEILRFLERGGLHTYDYVEFSGNNLVITRNPFGFINLKKHKGGKGSHKSNKKSSKNKTKRNVSLGIKGKVGYKVVDNMIQINPIKEESIEPDAKIEYYDRINPLVHQGGDGELFDNYDGVKLDENGNMSDVDFVKQVKTILVRNHLEIIEAGTKYEDLKALPDDKDEFINYFIDIDTKQMKNENLFKKRILGLTSYFRSAEEKLLPAMIKNENGDDYHIVPIGMSEYQFANYQKIRKEEIEQDKNKAKRKKRAADEDDLFKISSTYRIFSRSVCNFAFPDPPGRPFPDKKGENVDMDENDIDAVIPDADENNYLDDEDIENAKNNLDTTYSGRIKSALEDLKKSEEQYLRKENLSIYSPKFLKILENIQDPENIGLHLLYSQFRTIEGIGILKLILDANGFAEFKIKKNTSSDMWEIVAKEEDTGKPCYVLYTGTESVEEKEIILNIYNSKWDVVPTSITQLLKEKSANNFYGEIIKILMITAGAAEGTNLKNTRFVHIVEPYWHMVRLEQVIGRARRICSHQDLPEELRNVKVFLYLSVFADEQKNNKKNIELMEYDEKKTTDDYLFGISVIKSKINNNLLKAIKETAIDCSLYNPLNKEENLVCYGFGKVASNAFASYPTLEQDLGEKDEINVKKAVLKLKATKPIDGVIYAIDPKTNNLYDMKSYEQAQEGKGELILVGKIRKEGKQFVVDKF